MTCDEIENRLLDYEEGRLAAGGRDAVARHINDCAHCRTLARQLKQLDAQLARTVKTPALSATFNTKLRQRIQTTHVMTPTEIAERKRQMQAEYEAELAQFRPFALPSRQWFASLRYTAALITVALLAWRFLPEMPEMMARSGFNLPGQEFLPTLIFSVIFVVMGLMAAFPQQVSRLREAMFAR